MDSQVSGGNELLTIETTNIIFVIKGERFGTSSNAKLDVKVYSSETEDLQYKRGLYLLEYTNYEIVIISKNDTDIEFYHENINIRNKISAITSNSKNLSGIINFKGDIGFTDIYLKVDGKDEIKVTLEVYPSKISYKEDYENIIRDVNEEIYNLAYGFLGRTYLSSEVNNKKNREDSEFYNILNFVFKKLLRSIDIIIDSPHHMLRKEKKLVKYQSIKKVSTDTVKYLEKRPYLMQKVNNNYLPQKALVVEKTVTCDTKENRLLKFMLVQITRKIDVFLNKYKKINKSDKDIIINLENFKMEINKRINSSFLKNIFPKYNDADLSLVFTMAAGYKDVYKYYLMLQKGLSISSNIFNISIKELSLLYEYWCFIKINALLKKKYKLISTDFIKVYKAGVNVSLKKGKESCFTYLNPRTNEEFKVFYNGKRQSKTVGQRPDNILSMTKEGSSKRYEFIFDAKYKINSDEKYIERYGCPGPKEEDINTMHRYRDAIIYDHINNDESLKNSIFGAFVLFPYNDEEKFKNNKFYKSINEVNIGALPFLPSTTELMEEFLYELIDESSYSDFDRSLDQIGRKEYLKDDYLKKREVLVGTVRSREQLDLNLKNNFYYIPSNKVNLCDNTIKYIALAQSKKIFNEEGGIRWYGKVKKIIPVMRKEIKEIPSDKDDIYYRFEIEKWQHLENKIKVSHYQVRTILYTTLYLLKHADTVNELCLKNKEELRLWRELKRYDSNLNITEDDEKGVRKFNIKDTLIVIDGDSISSFYKDKVIKEKKSEFMKKPIKTIKKLLSDI